MTDWSVILLQSHPRSRARKLQRPDGRSPREDVPSKGVRHGRSFANSLRACSQPTARWWAAFGPGDGLPVTLGWICRLPGLGLRSLLSPRTPEEEADDDPHEESDREEDDVGCRCGPEEERDRGFAGILGDEHDEQHDEQQNDRHSSSQDGSPLPRLLERVYVQRRLPAARRGEKDNFRPPGGRRRGRGTRSGGAVVPSPCDGGGRGWGTTGRGARQDEAPPFRPPRQGGEGEGEERGAWAPLYPPPVMGEGGGGGRPAGEQGRIRLLPFVPLGGEGEGEERGAGAPLYPPPVMGEGGGGGRSAGEQGRMRLPPFVPPARGEREKERERNAERGRRCTLPL